MEQELEGLEGENKEFTFKERSEGVADVEVNGKEIPVSQERICNEDEESMTELLYTVEEVTCALTVRTLADEQSEYAKTSSPRRSCMLKEDFVH